MSRRRAPAARGHRQGRCRARDPLPVRLAEFVWLWNQDQGLGMPPLHLGICDWLEDAWLTGRRELLLMVFRDSGKSTLVGLYCAWLLARNPNLRILVLAADLELARKMVRNVKRIVERHPLCRHLRPSRKDQWASDRFTVRRSAELRDPSMIARGVVTNITGSRADVVICDDVEVPNTVSSPGARGRLRARLGEIEYVLVPEGTQLFVGTPHTYYTIYADTARREAGEDRPFLAGFDRLVLPVLDQKGESRWPERFPLAKLDRMRRRDPAKFQSQMLLEPTALSAGRLDPDKLVRYAAELDYREANGRMVLRLGETEMVSAACWWDPAYGARGGQGDGSVIAAVYVDGDGGYWLHRVRYLTFDPEIVETVDEATQLCRQVAGFVRTHYLPSVTVETNGLGKFLPGLLRREMRAARTHAAVVEIASRAAKDARIVEGFDVLLAAGALKAHDSVWDTPFIREMREWRPAIGARDDGLDAVSGCLLAEPVRLKPSLTPATPDDAADPDPAPWRPGAAPATAAAVDFDV